MSDGQPPFPPADEEEERAANALRQALEGRASGAAALDLASLDAASLETAALLRFSGEAGKFSSERRARLRGELLASLPAAPLPAAPLPAARPHPKRKSWWSWFGLGLPLVGATAAVGLFVARQWAEPGGARMAQRSEIAPPAAEPSAAAPSAASEPVAARVAAADEAQPALGAARAQGGGAAPNPRADAFEQKSRDYRARLLPKVTDARVPAIYAELDRARTPAELELAQTHLKGLVAEGPGSGESADLEPLRLDIFCRLAEVALRLGQAQAALDWTRRGLELDGEPNPFLARLFALQGQARNALGDPDGAAKSYMKALEVNEHLLDESLEGQ